MVATQDRMLLFRSLTLGMLGACLYLLIAVGSPPTRIRYVVLPQTAPIQTSIIDVAHGVTPAQLPGVIPLAPGEHVVAVAEQTVANDLQAGAQISMHAPAPNGFLELTVRSAGGSARRVLVLAH